jgi:hypothetical protein
MDAIDAITKSINVLIINFDGSIQRLLVMRLIIESEIFLLGKIPNMKMI